MDKPTLLIVDDDGFVRALLMRLLSDAGFQPAQAQDGTEALAYLADHPEVDTIILDRVMPGLDGMEVLQRVKADPVLREIPVILQTALGSEMQMKEGLAAGALYYLTKPIDPRLVVQVASAAISERKARRITLAAIEETRTAMGLIQCGVFRFQTLQQCHDLAALLGKACPDPRRTAVGLSELLINALEHGNLGITYDEKTQLIEQHRWQEEVLQRQQRAPYRDRHVEVHLIRMEQTLRFRIEDMGDGFDWQSFQEPNPDRIFDNHGRGILLAKWEAFDRITYAGRGNIVVAEVDA